MSPILLKVDFGKDKTAAIKFARQNPEMLLETLLEVYPDARFPKGEEPTPYLKRSLKDLQLQPVTVPPGDTDGRTPNTPGPAREPSLRDLLNDAWQAERSAQTDGGRREAAAPGFAPELKDHQAVRVAYQREMDAVADYLRHDLSVLVVCDKGLTEYLYEFVCNQAGKKVVLDAAPVRADAASQPIGAKLDRLLEGQPTNPHSSLPALIHDLPPNAVLVIRSLDLLDTPSLVEVLYQRTARGDKPQMLAFLDPSLEVKKVLTDRFAVHVSMTGLPRYYDGNGLRHSHAVSHLITSDEAACFARYDAEGLYKNVSGLNVLQFRNAMRYVKAKVSPGSDATTIYRMIRQFKTSSSEEIEIPDTSFDHIGGYDQIKNELRRIVALVSGAVIGISERERRQLIPRGFIFHGPPGTGKTLFAKAIANEMNATIQMISGPEIMDKYVGQSENNLRRIFATARRNAPAVVFFDEFDSIASQRSTYSDGGSRANNAVVAQFLTELDGFRQDQTVLVIGTTNRIDIIDEALLRPSRLRAIEIPNPTYPARQSVARIHARSFGIDRLLASHCELVTAHLAAWEESGATDADRLIPQGFLDALFEQHPLHKQRYRTESERIGFGGAVRELFAFVRDCRAQPNTDGAALDRVAEHLVKLGRRYNVVLSAEPGAAEPEDPNDSQTPMRTDLRDLFAALGEEQRQSGGLRADALVAGVLDLISEYSDGFNNDEIRAVFQEASLEYHLEGQLITPRYLGQKIGLIKKRREERDAVHLSDTRGRR
jgi:AAA+ superfamily predicted ATPase